MVPKEWRLPVQHANQAECITAEGVRRAGWWSINFMDVTEKDMHSAMQPRKSEVALVWTNVEFLAQGVHHCTDERKENNFYPSIRISKPTPTPVSCCSKDDNSTSSAYGKAFYKGIH